MLINGKEVNFKISNLKHATAMKQALEEMGKTEEEIKAMNSKDLVSVLTAMISMFRQFFITATGEDILQDCDDMQDARDAYELFLREISKQKKSVLAPYSVERIE